MPLYEYQCDACQQTVEVLVRSQAAQPSFPVCGTDRLEKLFSVPASPAIRSGGGLPVASRGDSAAQACGAPRCCGGGCQF